MFLAFVQDPNCGQISISFSAYPHRMVKRHGVAGGVSRLPVSGWLKKKVKVDYAPRRHPLYLLAARSE